MEQTITEHFVNDTYIPSLNVLTSVIEKKKQCDTQKYEHMIGIRHHTNINFLIDQLINIVVSHFDKLIFISISVTKSLDAEIPIALRNVCDYIKIIPPHNIMASGFDDYRFVTDHIIHSPNVEYEYFIYHTSSEYYIRKFNYKPDIIYEKRDDIVISTEELTKEFDRMQKWSWTHVFKKCDASKRLFINNGLLFTGNQVNGMLLPKYVMDDYVKFVSAIIKDPAIYSARGMIEILFQSYIYSKWRLVKCDGFGTAPRFSELESFIGTRKDYICITNCFWDHNHNASKIINEINDDIASDRINYLCIKRCDGNNNPLLAFAQKLYMSKRVSEILNY